MYSVLGVLRHVRKHFCFYYTYPESCFIRVWPGNVEIVEKNFVNACKEGMILILLFCKTLATTPQTFCRMLPKSGEKSRKYGRNVIYVYNSELPCVDFSWKSHILYSITFVFDILNFTKKSGSICEKHKSKINLLIKQNIIFAVPIIMRLSIAQYTFVDISWTKLFRQS